MKSSIRAIAPGLHFLLVRWRVLARTGKRSLCCGSVRSRAQSVNRAMTLIAKEFLWYIQEHWGRRTRVACPLCGWRGSSFRPVFAAPRDSDAGYRPRALCPSCLSRERHRLAAIVLTGLEREHPAPGRILHFAPESATRTRLERWASTGYIAADIAGGAVHVRLDASRLPVADASIGVIFCSQVLQYVEPCGGDLLALAEFARVLTPGGFALVTVERDDELARTIEHARAEPDDCMAIRRFGRDLDERLGATGLDVTRFAASDLQPNHRDRFGLGSCEIYLLRKAHAAR